jgi:hypothetical protein
MLTAARSTYDTDNRDINTTILNVRIEADPMDLMINALENLNDYGAFPKLYVKVLNALAEYAGGAIDAEDNHLLHDNNLSTRTKDFLLYLTHVED